MSSILIPATNKAVLQTEPPFFNPKNATAILYIHIPYCHHKCTYCGFYSVAGRHDMQAYTEALCRELEMRCTTKPLRTVYFGGGTPSLLPIELLEKVVDCVRRHFDISQMEEATIEANPENLTPSYLESLTGMGFFNRLSIGIQSFNDSELRTLNRVHDGRQAIEAIANASMAGFNNISVDLIMGLPGQDVADWQRNLDTLAGLASFNAVKHLSCYELTVEPGSILERQLEMGRVSMPDEEIVARQFARLQEWTGQQGFEQYEVSNFCRPGWHSRHNSRYWDRTPYIGVGAAAHSFDGRCRRWNIADAKAYIDALSHGVIPYEEERLTPKDAFNEYLMTALRTKRGIVKAEVEKCHASFYERLCERARPFLENGLLVNTPTAIVPTCEGMLHADGIASHLFV